MTISFGPVVPILRMFDVAVTKRFSVEYLGCSRDWESGEGDRPNYLQVSRGDLVLHLSSHHDDGTPGSAVLIEIRGVEELHAELHQKSYPFLNPGIEAGPGAGREMQLIDPASNRLRFYERAAPRVEPVTGTQTEVLRRLLDVALAVAAERRTEPVLRTVLDAARDIAGASYAAVAVPDPIDGIALFLTSGIDAQTWDAIGYLPRHHGLLGVLLKDPAPLRLDDIRADPRFTGWPQAHPQMRSFLGVPILAGGEILAELYLTDKVGGRPFTEGDQQPIETLAAHAALAIVNAQRLERARELSVAEERSRLARDLHDSVTQTLFSLSLSAETASTVAAVNDAALVAELDRVRLLSRAALGELRTLVDTLQAPDVEHEGLAVALRRRVALLQRVHDVPVELTIDDGWFCSSRTLDRELTRIAHEALANALQHAQPSRVEVTVTGGDTVRLVVQDDGCGFDLDATRRSSRRLGLSSMVDRAEAQGGTLEVRTAPGQGTCVTVEVPAD